MQRTRWLSKIIGASAPEIAISEPTERSMPPRGDNERHADADDHDRRYLGQIDSKVRPGREKLAVKKSVVERGAATSATRRAVVCAASRGTRDGPVLAANRPRAPWPTADSTGSATPQTRSTASLASADRVPPRAIACMMCVLVDLRVLELGHGATIAQHRYPVAAFDDLLDFGRDHQHAKPSSASSSISDWISALAPTSMPRVGSSSKQQPRIQAEPAGQQHFLLIAAGELADLLFRHRTS